MATKYTQSAPTSGSWSYTPGKGYSTTTPSTSSTTTTTPTSSNGITSVSKTTTTPSSSSKTFNGTSSSSSPVSTGSSTSVSNTTTNSSSSSKTFNGVSSSSSPTTAYATSNNSDGNVDYESLVNKINAPQYSVQGIQQTTSPNQTNGQDATLLKSIMNRIGATGDGTYSQYAPVQQASQNKLASNIPSNSQQVIEYLYNNYGKQALTEMGQLTNSQLTTTLNQMGFQGVYGDDLRNVLSASNSLMPTSNKDNYNQFINETTMGERKGMTGLLADGYAYKTNGQVGLVDQMVNVDGNIVHKDLLNQFGGDLNALWQYTSDNATKQAYEKANPGVTYNSGAPLEWIAENRPEQMTSEMKQDLQMERELKAGIVQQQQVMQVIDEVIAQKEQEEQEYYREPVNPDVYFKISKNKWDGMNETDQKDYMALQRRLQGIYN